MPERLPLFPLPIVVLPGELVPLHIFEERYKTMLGHVRHGDQQGRPLPFAITFQSGAGVATIACSVRLQRVLAEHEDGRLDILTVGERRVRIQEVFDDQPYFEAAVEWFEDHDEPLDLAVQERALALATKLAELQVGQPVLLEAQGQAPLSFRLALLLDLAPEGRQVLLQARSENLRLVMIAQHIRELIADLDVDAAVPPGPVN